MARVDLTKLLNKMTVENLSPNGDVIPTTDFVKIKSWNEIENYSDAERRKPLTDFAILNNAFQSALTKKIGRYTGQYYLRSYRKDPWEQQVGLIDYEGESTYTGQYFVSSVGTCPSLEINISKYLSLSEEERDSIKIKQVKKYNKEKHFLEMGEYPKNAVDKKLGNMLEELFNYGYLQENLTCTGKLYPSITNQNFTRQNPEFEYQGEKYVRVTDFNCQGSLNSLSNKAMLSNRGKAHWLKVEPIVFEIKNWENLPSEINPNSKGTNISDVIELEADDIIFAGAPFYPYYQHLNSFLWQNSLLRAFLNSADSKDLDGAPQFQTTIKFDFSKSGFLQPAFNLTIEPLREYTIPEDISKIAEYTFHGCVGIKKVIINNHVKEIESNAFLNCPNIQLVFNDINKSLNLADDSIDWNIINYTYLSKSQDTVIFSPYIDPELEKNCVRIDYEWENLRSFFDKNYRQNITKIKIWKEEGKVKFIPPDYTLKTFPHSDIEKFFINGNNRRWENLVKTLGFDRLEGIEKTNSLVDLMKIYYVIGGFSDNQSESEKAFDYIIKYVARVTDNNPASYSIGRFIHSKFSKLEINGPYNKTFAQFFMKYYKDNSDFMNLELASNYYVTKDYLCQAHNNFDKILKAFPNRVVNGNEERALLTPKFVAEHSTMVDYHDVEYGNEELAEMIGKYGYSQENFEEIQEIYNSAKNSKEEKVIQTGKIDNNCAINFRLLEKDDSLGFVLGDITNCCQHIGGVGEDCVIDGYKNKNAGFLVFEENILDKNGNQTEEKRILGQAYIWYDPETKTVCYDNIEIPSKVLSELRNNNKHDGKSLTSSAFIDVVERSAKSIMNEMNKNGIKVERITTGKGYNDLAKELSQKFKEEENPKAKHRGYTGYSDAKSSQFIIKTYDSVTKAYGNVIKETISNAKDTLNEILDSNTYSNLEM